MAPKTQHEIYEILKSAHQEHSYNYSLDFGTPEFTPKAAPAFLDYWKFNDVLHAFNDPSSVNWQTIESIISNQTPMEIKQDLPYGWVRNHLQNFNYYLLQQNSKPIEISRYAGWTIANHMQNKYCDTSFQKAYFITPNATEKELAQTAKIINYTTERIEISKNVSKINGIIGGLAEKYLINHSQISRDFWRSIYTHLFGTNYNFNPKLSKKHGYLDYMDFKLLQVLNIRLKALIEEWNTNIPQKNQTPNHFIDMASQHMTGISNTLQTAPIMLIKDKKLTPIAADFAKQEQKFIKQFVKSK